MEENHDFESRASLIHELALRRIAVGAKVHLANFPGVVRDISLMVEHGADQLILGLKTYCVTADHFKDPLVVKRWASWWDHFKADVFPAWALKLWPPRQEDELFLRPYDIRVCPHHDVKWPKNEHIRFLMRDGQP